MSLHRLLPLAILVSATPLLAQTTQTWNTNAASNWSTPESWSLAGNPSGNSIVFGDDFGKTASATTVGNTVDQNYTINSLAYTNQGTTGNFWQVTAIAAGATLTLDAIGTPPANILSVGSTSGSTRAAIRGAGALVISEPTSKILVGGPSTTTSAVLDLSGLSSFTANVSVIDLGGNSNRGNGDLLLAASNLITATTINLGTSIGSTTAGTKSDLLLGTSNTINVDLLNVGLNFAAGSVAFQSGLTGASVVIRGAAGGASRADLIVANTGATTLTNGQNSVVDFRGGAVDAFFDEILIARRGDAGGSNNHSGTFAMNQGTVNTNTLVVAQSAGAGLAANTAKGTVLVEGGSLVVNNTVTLGDNSAGQTNVDAIFTVSGGNVTVTGDFIAGQKNGSAASVASTLNISAGTMLIGGNLAEGAGASEVTSTVNLSGGSLDLDHGAIKVDSFNFTGGVLKNVASFEAGATGGLNVQNASSLAFDIGSGFTSMNLTGSLTLGANSNLVLSLAEGFGPGASFTLVLNDLADQINGRFLTVNGAAFGAGDTFVLTNDQGSFQYQLNYAGGSGNDLVISAVPEPTTLALLAMLGIVGAVSYARRR